MTRLQAPRGVARILLAAPRTRASAGGTQIPGRAVADLDGKAVGDPYAAVRVDVGIARQTLPAGLLVSGLVYDVTTGLIEVVVLSHHPAPSATSTPIRDEPRPHGGAVIRVGTPVPNRPAMLTPASHGAA
jgi:hypothetical protein